MNQNEIFNTQLSLPLKFRELKNNKNFLINASNEIAVSFVDHLNQTDAFKKKFTYPILLVYGPEGSGKSHLATIFKETNDAMLINQVLPKHLNIAVKGGYFVLDDFDSFENLDEKMVMHLFNEVSASTGGILILSKLSPKEMNFNLPDFRSRMSGIINVEIKLPNDNILYSILIKELEEKKLKLSDDLCLYIIKRIKRNYKFVIRFVEELDRYSLEIKDKIKLKHVKKILNYINKN